MQVIEKFVIYEKDNGLLTCLVIWFVKADYKSSKSKHRKIYFLETPEKNSYGNFSVSLKNF